APIHSENPSDKGICPQCGTSLPSQALFCSSCGERIVKQEDDTTVRLPSLSREHLKGLPLYRSPSKLWGWLPALSLTSAAGRTAVLVRFARAILTRRVASVLGKASAAGAHRSPPHTGYFALPGQISAIPTSFRGLR